MWIALNYTCKHPHLRQFTPHADASITGALWQDEVDFSAGDAQSAALCQLGNGANYTCQTYSDIKLYQYNKHSLTEVYAVRNLLFALFVSFLLS